MRTSTQFMTTHAPASAQIAAKGWKRKLLPGALAVAFLGLTCTNANAIEFSKDEWSGSFDTTVSYGAIWRAGDFKDDYVGKSTFNPYNFALTNEQQRQNAGNKRQQHAS